MAFVGCIASLNTCIAKLYEFTMSACPADNDLEIEIPRYNDMVKT